MRRHLNRKQPLRLRLRMLLQRTRRTRPPLTCPLRRTLLLMALPQQRHPARPVQTSPRSQTTLLPPLQTALPLPLLPLLLVLSLLPAPLPRRHLLA
jgi:hypothetical protein